MAITKNPKNVNEYAYAAKLYYDDIVEIISILKELNPSEIEISSDNFVFDNVEDLLAFDKKHISALEITSHNPYVYIGFEPNSIRLFSTEDRHEVVGAIHKIKLFLKTKRPFFAFHIHWTGAEIPFMLLYGTLSVIIAFLLYLYLTYPYLSVPYSVLFGLGAYGLAVTYHHLVYRKNYSSIFLLKKSEQNSFFARNKDQIMLLLFGSLVGGIVTMAITFLTGK